MPAPSGIAENSVVFASFRMWEGQILADGARHAGVTPTERDSPRSGGQTPATSLHSKHTFGSQNRGSWVARNRRWIAVVCPAVLFHIFWWSYMSTTNRWSLFSESVGAVPRYAMTITMVFGSFIAGATSEGGASIAFPVMTLAFRIKPLVARDFSLAIQSCGMTAAAATILTMRVRFETSAFIWSSLGGAVGIALGLEYVAPALPPAFAKMYFVSVWFAFAFSLYWLNRIRNRVVHLSIQNVDVRARIVLFVAGGIGGVLSSVAGSGIDICVFAVLTLLFRVSEKVATPTSVLLMAANTLVGFTYRQIVQGGIASDAWGFLLVCLPVVVIGAPLGSFCGSHFHRLVLAAFVYATDTIQLIGAFAIVPQTPLLAGTSVGFIAFGAFMFWALARRGQVLLDRHLSEVAATKRSPQNVQMQPIYSV